MTPYEGIAANDKSIHDVVRQRLRVPEYQRSYSWRKQEWAQFWEDLTSFYDEDWTKDDANAYFLGTIVLTKSDGGLQVLDGQQRLATYFILLSALIDAIRATDEKAAERIKSTYLGQYRPLKKQFEYFLQLNRYDRAFFERFVLDGNDKSKPTAPSHKLIVGAKRYFEHVIDEKRSVIPEPDAFTDWAQQFTAMIGDSVVVVAVTLGGDDAASQLFESLNDRGIGLSTLDLFRNYVLHRVDEARREDIAQNWWRILELGPGSRPEELLRAYWITREGDVKARRLFRDIKTKIEARDLDVAEIADELLSLFADTYDHLVQAEDEDPEAERWLKAVKALGARALYPALLSAKYVLPPGASEFTTFASLLVSYYVRHTLIGGKESTQLEAFVFNLARSLRHSGDINQALSTLRGRIVADTPDQDFKKAFATASLSTHASAKYILGELDLSASSGEKPEFGHKVHLEHIYPQRPSAGHRLPEQDEIIDRIGNLTLLLGKWNQKLSNRPFPEKVGLYRQSDFKITNSLARLKKWDIAHINDRQVAFGKHAVLIWGAEGN